MMLRGKKICLRAVEPEDLDLMYRVENDTSLWEYGNANVPYSRYALRRYIEETTHDLYADGRLRLVISVLSGESVGFIDLQNFDPRHGRAEVGIVLLPEWQRRGLGAEALSLLLSYAAGHLHLHQVYAVVSADNQAAMALFLRAKFKPSGTLSEWLCRGTSDYADACMLTLLLA